MYKQGPESPKSPTNVYDYEKYVNLSIRWNRWLLKPMGLWPNSPDASAIEKSFGWLINATCYCLISFLVIACGLYGVLDVHDVYDKLKVFGPLSFYLMAIAKYCCLMFHAKDIRECVEHIEWDWKTIRYRQDRDVMVANANFGSRLVMFCTLFMYSSFVLYYIAMPISVGTVELDEGNLTFIPVAFPFSRSIVDTRYSPANEIIISIQILGGVLIHSIAAAACSLIVVFAVHACGQMEVLMCWLGHLVHGREDMQGTADDRIASIVNQHVRILKFLAVTEKTLQQVSFVEFLGCTLNMCLVVYYVLTDWSANDITAIISYHVILISLTLNIFLFCYIGELVAEQCKMVGEMSYMVDWHELRGRRKIGFVLIIAMSNCSKHLTAGNMVELSISTFGDEWRNNDLTAAITFGIILLSLTFNIFIFCYLGELVAERFRQIGETSYMIDWYLLPGKTKRGVILIMAISESAMRLTAGNVVKLSLNCFADVVKTAFAFLNMLRTLT